MKGATCLQIVIADLHLVSELLSSEDKSDLTDLDTLLFLKSLLDLENSVVTLEVEWPFVHPTWSYPYPQVRWQKQCISWDFLTILGSFPAKYFVEL